MANSPWQRIENNAIFKVSHRKKRKTLPAANQIETFDYVHGLLQAKWNRIRLTR
ncbi:NinE family protein [Rahnella sp. AA]|nr:NinE family protein [Rahnella sp. AA]